METSINNNFTEAFLLERGILIDARSPKEFSHAHIPGAHNLPLFSDAERSDVGIVYKKQGKEIAIELALKIVGPKLYNFVKTAKDLSQGELIKLYCARGGMRSSSMAWLLKTAQLKVETLPFGYKKFRLFVLQSFLKPYQLRVIGGLTGSGKTDELQTLSKKGAQIIDLEELANHKGSSFGMLGKPNAPSIEQFENLIAMRLLHVDLTKPIWIEDESRLIGRCKIPDSLFAKMRASPLYVMNKSREERVLQLLKDYGEINPIDLIGATRRLSKHLGSEKTEFAVSHIENKEYALAINILLDYYDAKYTHGLSKRSQPIYPYEPHYHE